jgi:hypothetical protein
VDPLATLYPNKTLVIHGCSQGIPVYFRVIPRKQRLATMGKISIVRYDPKVPSQISSEVIIAGCKTSKELKQQILIQNVEKPNITMERMNKDGGAGNGLKLLPKNKPINTILLLIDSLSRSAFYRVLPKTINTLLQLNQGTQFQVFQFFRYNVVQCCSPGNQVNSFFFHFFSFYDRIEFINF